MPTSKRKTGDTRVRFLLDTYSAEELREQATLLNRYVQHLSIDKKQKKTKSAAIPAGDPKTAEFKKNMAINLYKADEQYNDQANGDVNATDNLAALQSEARKRGVDIARATTKRKLKVAILQQEADKGRALVDFDWEDQWEAEGKEGKAVAARMGGTAPKLEVYEVTGIRTEDGSTEYEVWWRPCEANGWSKKEKTWEVSGCSLVKGGLDRHIRKYRKALHEGEGRKADRKRKASAGEKKKDCEEEGDEESEEAGYEDEGEEEEREKRSRKRKAADEGGDKGEDLEGLCKQIAGLTAALAARQKGLEGQVEQMQKTTERMADLHEQHSSGAEGRVKKEKLATGEEAGVLGLLKTWEEKGEERFSKHIETQKWHKQDQVDSDREEARRMNELIDRRERVERQMRELQEHRDRKPGDSRLETLAQSKAHQWIEVLEDLYMAYTVWKEDNEDSKVARHMWEVYKEAKYDTTEDRRALQVRKEAEKRAKKERIVLRDDAVAVAVARRGDSDGEKDQSSRDEGRSEDRKAEEVFEDCPEEMRGKYVTVGDEDLFEKPLLRMAHNGVSTVGSKRQRTVCILCKGRGHTSWECKMAEYEKEGKTFITPLRLYKQNLVDGYGRVKRSARRQEEEE